MYLCTFFPNVYSKIFQCHKFYKNCVSVHSFNKMYDIKAAFKRKELIRFNKSVPKAGNYTSNNYNTGAYVYNKLNI